MYEIWMRNYPQPDINVTEEWKMPQFRSLQAANLLIENLEKMYADDAWAGHRNYRAKFYAEDNGNWK